MDAFNCAGNRQGVLNLSSTSFSGGQGDDRADTLAARKQAMPHGAVDSGGLGAC